MGKQSIFSFLTAGAVMFSSLVNPLAGLAQQPSAPQQSGTPAPVSPPAGQSEQERDAVVRITTQLIQIDTIVTDKRGEHIDDLKAEDFELLVDGKAQPLSFFKLLTFASPPAAAPNAKAAKTLPVPPARPLKEEEIKRTIALVVDDLRLPLASLVYTKDALKNFVATQMQEGDLVAVITTARGMGFYQQFTNDKRILYAAIERLRWSPNAQPVQRFGAGSDGVFQTSAERQQALRDNGGRSSAADRVDEYRESLFASGTLGALNHVVRSLRYLPGRKLAVTFAPPLVSKSPVMEDRIKWLSDQANRASVAFYVIDPAGLIPPGAMASDDVGINRNRDAADIDSFNDKLRDLAYRTGGVPHYNNNNTEALVRKVIQDNRSFYLLGFDPDDEKFDKKYHRIKVNVRRPGLQVRNREGFFGFPDSLARETPRTPEARFLQGLFSPFAARDISFQATAFFHHAAKGEPAIRAYFHIDCSGLQFKDEPNGEKSVTLQLANFIFSETGLVAEHDARQFTLRFDEAQYRAALAEGLSYAADFPVKKRGAYHFRSVLQDTATDKLGSASQFIQIPDLANNRLALSGLTLSGKLTEGVTPAAFASSSSGKPHPAVRRFTAAHTLEFRAVAYNAELDKSSRAPQLSLQFELYRNNQRLFQSPTNLVPTDKADNLKQLGLGGGLRLRSVPPGQYLLRVVVADLLVKGRHSQVEQWMDFSVE